MMRSILRSALPLAVFATACTAGEGRDRAGVAVRDSAGIRVVENRGGDVPLGLAAVHLADLAPPDDALTAVPWGIAADPMTGRIYVMDWTGARVAAFDRAAAYAGSLGRAGDGPGEFRNPTALAIDPHGALAVWDAGRGILSRWSSEGMLLNEQRAPVEYWGHGLAVRRAGIVTVTAEQAPSGTALLQRLVDVTPDGQRTLYELPQEMSMMRLPGINMPAPKVLAPAVIWTSRGDSIYVLNGPGYRIDIFGEDGPVASFRRAIEPIPVTERVALAAVESGPGPYSGFLQQTGLTAEQIVRAVGHEEVVSTVQWITVDPAGRLWVTRSADGLRPGLVDVLSAAGEYLGTLEAPVLPVAFLSDSLFVGVRMDELGQTTVSLYRLQDAGDRAEISGGRSGGGADAASAGVRQDRSNPSGLREFRDCSECPLLVELPPGRFVMGRPDGEEPAARNPQRPEWTELAEMPQVEVEIAYPLAVGKYEVTFAEWDRCVAAGGCSHQPGDMRWGRGDRPVMNVTRADAEEYIAWLRTVSGQPYRLPSEAEWEYAARAGTTTARRWGDELGQGNTVCDGCGSRWDKRSTVPAGSFAPNGFGLHDMLGNVSEWVADCWHASHEGHPGDGSARIESSPWWKDGACERPTKRGGAWDYFTWTVRAAHRSNWRPHPVPGQTWAERTESVGFRVARTVAR